MQYIIDFHTNSNPLPWFKLSMTALFVKLHWAVIVLIADMTQKIPFGKDEGLKPSLCRGCTAVEKLSYSLHPIFL